MSGQPTATTGAGGSARAGAVHSTRYQRWQRRLRAAGWTWPAMVAYGVKVALRNTQNILLLLPSLGFVVAAGALFYVLSLLEGLVGTPRAQGLYQFAQVFLRVDLTEVARLGEYRLQLWQGAFLLLIKVQLFYLLVMVGQLGPGLIANDLKTRALPIYFARPITPLTYLLGKWLTIGVFIALAMPLPNLAALGVGVLVAGAPGTWSQTLGLAGDLALGGAVVMLVGGFVILALSSITADRRFVLVGWLAVALLPHMAQQILYQHLQPGATTRLLGSLSLSNDVLLLTTWLFDLRRAWEATGLPPGVYQAALGREVQPLYPMLVLLGTAGLAAAICYRRVVRFSRAAANI
ncbi:MAG: hypothetical protein AB1716_04605 [Planctomycetota bacterium]